jgi:hypothetical protein
MSDLLVRNEGTLVLLRPTTDAAATWLRESTPEDATWWGGALVVEPRYVESILFGAADEGFTIGPEN